MKMLALLLWFALALVGCIGPGTPTATPPTTLGPRPSTLATVRFLEPTQGATVTGASLHVVLELEGATIVPETTTAIRPDQGHLHLYVDNQLVSMNYGLEQDVPVTVGAHAVKAEFVAADHAPFNPRVWTEDIVFTVSAGD